MHFTTALFVLVAATLALADFNIINACNFNLSLHPVGSAKPFTLASKSTYQEDFKADPVLGTLIIKVSHDGFKQPKPLPEWTPPTRFIVYDTVDNNVSIDLVNAFGSTFKDHNIIRYNKRQVPLLQQQEPVCSDAPRRQQQHLQQRL